MRLGAIQLDSSSLETGPTTELTDILKSPETLKC